MNIAQRILASLYRVFGPPVHTFDVHGDLMKSTGQQNLEMPREASTSHQEFYDRIGKWPSGRHDVAAEEGGAPRDINYFALAEYAYANKLDYNELCAVVRRAVLNR